MSSDAIIIYIQKGCALSAQPFLAETEGFEPSCRLLGKLISSQPRYDRFDTSPHIRLIYFNGKSSSLQPSCQNNLSYKSSKVTL